MVLVIESGKYSTKMGRVVKKPAFCIFENKAADQLHGKRAADQHLCFHCIDSSISLLPKSSHLECVSDLVRNPKDRFSLDAAQMV